MSSDYRMYLDTSKVSSNDWEKFQSQFEAAAAFLTRASLRGELATLKKTTRNEWQEQRLKELSDVNKITHFMTE